MKEILCYNNQLTELPNLPQQLTNLYCNNKQLSINIKLKNIIYYLQCHYLNDSYDINYRLTNNKFNFEFDNLFY